MRTVTGYDPYDVVVQADPYPSYAWLRDESPAHRLANGAWVLSRYDDVADSLRAPELFSSAGGVAFGALGGIGTLIGMDPPDHTRLRRMLSTSFTPRAVLALEPEVQKIADTLIDAAAASPITDVVGALAAPLPTRVIAGLLGIDAEQWPTYKRWSDELNACSWSDGPPDEVGMAFMQTGMEAGAFFLAEIEQRRAEPSRDLIGQLVAAQATDDALDDGEIVNFCVLLMLAGNVTTTALISSGLCTLADHPEALATLQAEPERIAEAVEEMVRFESPIQGFCRTLTTDIERHGQRLAAGDKVMLLYGSANRDPRTFPDAHRFDLGRVPNPHLGFGAGVHLCLGAALARLEARVLLERLLPRVDAIDRVAGDPPTRVQIPAFRELARAPLRMAWT